MWCEAHYLACCAAHCAACRGAHCFGLLRCALQRVTCSLRNIISCRPKDVNEGGEDLYEILLRTMKNVNQSALLFPKSVIYNHN